MLYTLSAIQILALANQLDRVDSEKVARFISSLQQPDGSFYGDKWGEVDTRFSYCALSAVSLLGRLESKDIDVQKAVEYVGRWKC
jgi:geranylgeranyl transferase type-2 subunit beta